MFLNLPQLVIPALCITLRAADDIGDAARAGRSARAGASLADDAYTARALSREADAASLIGGTCNSFSADTTVATPDGDIPIAEIEVGDLVYAWDELSDTISVYTVSDTISHIDPVIVLLTIGDETIETTPEHPFYTLERGWVNAEDLRFGERVPQRDGEIAAVLNIELVQRTQQMYNLTVEVAHTFFVGDQQWLVHNANFENCSDDELLILKQIMSQASKKSIGPTIGASISNGQVIYVHSGWKDWKGAFEDGEYAIQQAMKLALEMNHTFPKGYGRGKLGWFSLDGKLPGKYYASHAEVQLAALMYYGDIEKIHSLFCRTSVVKGVVKFFYHV